MDDKQSYHVAQLFRQQCMGYKLTKWERNHLQVLLDKMEAPERAGAIAAIIKIMLEVK